MSEVRFLHVPIEWVFDAFIDPHRLAGWLSDGAFVEPWAGGRYELRFRRPAPEDEDARATLVGEITSWRAPVGLAIGWPAGAWDRAEELELEMEAGLGGTHVKLTYRPGQAAPVTFAEGETVPSIWRGALESLETYFGSLDR